MATDWRARAGDAALNAAADAASNTWNAAYDAGRGVAAADEAATRAWDREYAIWTSRIVCDGEDGD